MLQSQILSVEKRYSETTKHHKDENYLQNVNQAIQQNLSIQCRIHWQQQQTLYEAHGALYRSGAA